MKKGSPATAAALLAAIAGCATDPGRVEPAHSLRVETATLSLAPHANDRRPVRVSLVRVADERIAEELVGTAGSDWFEAGGRDAFLAAHPTAIHDWWEVVPGTTIGPFDLRVRHRHAGVLLCDVGARTPLRVEREGDLHIGIDDDGCRVEGGEPSAESGLFARLIGR